VSRSLGPSSGLKGLLIGTAFGAILPGGRSRLSGGSGTAHGRRRFRATIAMVSWTLIGYGRAVAWELPTWVRIYAVRIVISLPIPVLAGALGRFVYVRMYRKASRHDDERADHRCHAVGSVLVLGFIAFRRRPRRRGVSGARGRDGLHQHRAADRARRDRLAISPRSFRPRSSLAAGPGFRLARRPHRRDAGGLTPGGPVVGFSIGAVALKVGGGPPSDRLCGRLGPVRLPAADTLGNPFMPARFVWFRAAVSLPFPFLAAALAMAIGSREAGMVPSY